MKLNVSIAKYKPFKLVNYYTFQIEGESLCEAERFNTKFENSEHIESYQTIKYWLGVIGNTRGARASLFRKESLTKEERYENSVALPPNSEIINEDSVFKATIVSLTNDNDTTTERDLRLYCIRMSDSVVILYNGDVKTAQLVRDCVNCYEYFKDINSLDSQIHNQAEKFELAERRIKSHTHIKLELTK